MNPEDFGLHLHRIAENLLKTFGEMGISEAHVNSRLYDAIEQYAHSRLLSPSPLVGSLWIEFHTIGGVVRIVKEREGFDLKSIKSRIERLERRIEERRNADLNDQNLGMR